MRLVAAHADWWNVHTGIVDRLDEMRPFSGSARARCRCRSRSFRPSGSREEIEATARRRFGPGPIVGTGPELVNYFGSLRARGVERLYVWFCDFAPPDTLAGFGDAVIGQLGDAGTPSTSAWSSPH